MPSVGGCVQGWPAPPLPPPPRRRSRSRCCCWVAAVLDAVLLLQQLLLLLLLPRAGLFSCNMVCPPARPPPLPGAASQKPPSAWLPTASSAASPRCTAACCCWMGCSRWAHHGVCAHRSCVWVAQHQAARAGGLLHVHTQHSVTLRASPCPPYTGLQADGHPGNILVMKGGCSAAPSQQKGASSQLDEHDRHAAGGCRGSARAFSCPPARAACAAAPSPGLPPTL